MNIKDIAIGLGVIVVLVSLLLAMGEVIQTSSITFEQIHKALIVIVFLLAGGGLLIIAADEIGGTIRRYLR